jgi:hypothetical protein
MAGRLVPMRVGGIELLVETAPVAGSEQTAKVGEAAGRVVDAFERAQEAIVEVAASTVDLLKQASDRGARPDHVEVQFGLKFSAQGHVILAGASAEASLTVKLVYDATP